MNIEPVEVKIGAFVFDGLACGPAEGELVLCLHGFPQFAESFESLLVDLGENGFRAAAINQRGYSKRAKPKGVDQYSIDKLVQDVADIADALGARKFHLIGHDWGGNVAWSFAEAFQHRLQSLTILSTPHLSAMREALLTNLDQLKKSSYIALFKSPFHLAEKVLTAENWKLLRKSYQGHVSSEQVERNIERLGEDNTLTCALNYYRAALHLAGVDPVCRVPTLYLWGSEDQALGSAAAANTAKYVEAPYEFVRFQDVSHWLLDEKPKEVAAKILPFLSQYRLHE